jgi:hypothetical protein
MPRKYSRNFVDLANSPPVAIAAALGVAFYIVYYLTKFRLSSVWPLKLRGDAEAIFAIPQRIFADSAYPTDVIFPYSPSAVLIFYGLGIGGPQVFMAVWYVLMMAGLILAVRASLVQERRDVQAAWLLIGLIGLLLADLPIDWELRGTNSNLIYLGTVMAGYALLGSWPVIAGSLIGLSVSLKLYSGLLLLWLFLNGQRRAMGAAAVTMLFLWVVLPAAIFDAGGATRLYAGWRAQLQAISDPVVHARPDLPVVSMQHAIISFTGQSYDSAATFAQLSLLWSIWLAALSWYVWRCRPYAVPVPVPSRAALADWVVLLLAPLLFSPWLEPNHCVPLLVAALLCVLIAVDANMMRRDRMAALAGVATLALAAAFRFPFAIRGFQFGAEFLVLVIVLGVIRPRLRAPAAPAVPDNSWVRAVRQ